MPRDIKSVVRSMTLKERCTLTAGADMFATAAVPRVGIPEVRLTDGPNGARGPNLTSLIGSDGLTSVCVPCGSALGATWDPDLVQRVGALIGREARAKNCRVLLAPTVNLHRSPLGGRNFESFGEDPLLVGKLAAAYIRGAQSEGVATTVKHFVANESEEERMTIDTIVDERTLRELYFVPFELAVREAGVLGVMTSYNRLNGDYCANSDWLLHTVLREEWGFEGFVLTDWLALLDTQRAITAGTDLEMPGPARCYGYFLETAVSEGKIEEQLVNAAVARLLTVFDKIGALDDPPATESHSVDLIEDRKLAYEAAAASMVLLANDGMLPLKKESLRKVAIIGPNAGRAVIMGGGSAQLAPHYLTSPLHALRERLGPDVVVYEPGADITKATPAIPTEWLTSPAGEPGFAVAVFAGHDLASEPVAHLTRQSGGLWWFSPPPGATPEFCARATATLKAPEAGAYTLTLCQRARARVFIDGKLVLDGMRGIPGTTEEFFLRASGEISMNLQLEADQRVELMIELFSTGRNIPCGARIGIRPGANPNHLAKAVAAAKGADAVILVVGTDHQWETEGHDRNSLSLPGRQDELIEAITTVNPNTVIVVNAGAPVDMPWVHRARALLQIWFGGQEMSAALADVLLGRTEPGGRLPTTLPSRLEHNPSYGNFPAENGVIRYGEGVFIGYRWYESRRLPVRYPFGHGLSYSTFSMAPPLLSSETIYAGESLEIRVWVTNTGARAGAEVVQCYVAPFAHQGIHRPIKELKAFAKILLPPGESREVKLLLDARSFAYWRTSDTDTVKLTDRLPLQPVYKPDLHVREQPSGWQIDTGIYEIHIGRSSSDIVHRTTVTVTSPSTVARGGNVLSKGAAG